MLKARAVSIIRSVVTNLSRAFAAASRLVDLRIRRSPPSLKALLAAAPLEGIDLRRARDRGRDVHL
jgi:hypothetical protein